MSDRSKRNEVFTSAQPSAEDLTAKAAMPRKNVMKEDFEWEVPVELVPIPSKGSVYSENTSLFNKESIEIKAMTAREEDILTSRALLKNGTVITKLLQSCIMDKSIDVQNMLLGDRNAVMIAIRITGYGSEYVSSVTCPECSETSDQTFDLAGLEIKRLDVNPESHGENRFSYILPITKRDVQFRFLTGQDEEEMSKTADRKKKLMPEMQVESLVTSRLAQSILSIGGVEDRSKINSFVANMPARDSRALRSYMTKHEPGIVMDVWMDCSHCGETSSVSLPLGSSFFWPS